MFFIPGTLIAVLTFPGIIIHELAHKVACDWTGVKVYETCYFRVGNPAGYVVHESVYNYRGAFLITVAPFLINTFIALVVFAIAVNVPSSIQWIAVVLYWFGISIAMHSFPSSGDAGNLWDYSKAALRYNLWALFGFPIAILIILADILSVIWFDLIYAVALLFAIAALFSGGNLF